MFNWFIISRGMLLHKDYSWWSYTRNVCYVRFDMKEFQFVCVVFSQSDYVLAVAVE